MTIKRHAGGAKPARSPQVTIRRHAVELARAVGARRMFIASDPFAEPFYRAMGAVRIGETPSDAIPGRVIPLLMYRLAAIPQSPLSAP